MLKVISKIDAIYSICNERFNCMSALYMASLIDDIPIKLVRCGLNPTKHVLSGEGKKILDFRAKQQLISIKANIGKVIVWSDLDVVFLGKIQRSVLSALGTADLCLLREKHYNDTLNGGFVVMHCSHKLAALWQKVVNSDMRKWWDHDQGAIHHFLKKSHDIRFNFLPINKFCCHHLRCDSKDLLMYHSTGDMSDNSFRIKIANMVGRLKSAGQWERVMNSMSMSPDGVEALKAINKICKVLN